MCKNSPTPALKRKPHPHSCPPSPPTYAEKYQVPRAVTTEDKVLPCLVKASARASHVGRICSSGKEQPYLDYLCSVLFRVCSTRHPVCGGRTLLRKCIHTQRHQKPNQEPGEYASSVLLSPLAILEIL